MKLETEVRLNEFYILTKSGQIYTGSEFIPYTPQMTGAKLYADQISVLLDQAMHRGTRINKYRREEDGRFSLCDGSLTSRIILEA